MDPLCIYYHTVYLAAPFSKMPKTQISMPGYLGQMDPHSYKLRTPRCRSGSESHAYMLDSFRASMGHILVIQNSSAELSVPFILLARAMAATLQEKVSADADLGSIPKPKSQGSRQSIKTNNSRHACRGTGAEHGVQA